MNRNTLIGLAFAAVATGAFADDITVDTTPFTSTATRAEVTAEQRSFEASGRDPWAKVQDRALDVDSQRQRSEVVGEFLRNRDAVAELTSEDSGSSYLATQRAAAGASSAGD